MKQHTAAVVSNLLPCRTPTHRPYTPYTPYTPVMFCFFMELQIEFQHDTPLSGASLGHGPQNRWVLFKTYVTL